MAGFFETHRPLSLEDILNRPIPEWLIDGVLLEKGLYVIFGAPGTGKTYVAIDMALAIALGSPFAAREAKRRAVHLFLGEGGDSTLYRVPAAVKALGCDWEDLAGSLTVCETVPSFLEFEEMAEEDLEQFRGSTVIVDPLVRAANGLDLNDNVDASSIMAGFSRLIKEAGCTVVLIHHEPKHGEGQRATEFGSVFIRSALDGSFRVSSNDGGRVFEASKERETSGGLKLRFEVKGQLVEGAGGVAREFGAVRWLDGPVIGDLEEAALLVIKEVYRPGERFTSGVFRSDQVKDNSEELRARVGGKLFDDLSNRESRKAKSVLDGLFESGLLVKMPAAKGGTQYYALPVEERVAAA